MAQCVKHLPRKCEGPHSIPRTHLKTASCGMAVIPSASLGSWEVETAESRKLCDNYMGLHRANKQSHLTESEGKQLHMSSVHVHAHM